MTSISAYLGNSFKKHNNKPAISFLRDQNIETILSFSELDINSNKMANLFLNMGIKKRDNVILMCNKSLIFVVIYIALQKIGAVCIPLNPGFKESELNYLVNDAKPSLVITEPEKIKIIKKITPYLKCMKIDTEKPFQEVTFFRKFPQTFTGEKINPLDPGLIIYTSGTTGRPKGAVLTQKNLTNDAKNIIKIWEISDSDTLCHALPLFHVHGLCFGLHTPLIAGAHIILTDKFTPKIIINLLKENRNNPVSIFMAVPSMYLKLIEYLETENNSTSHNFNHIRLLTSGSAPLRAKDFHKIKKVFGIEPVEREGMSETGMNFSNPLHGKKKPGSIGIPLPGVKVRIVDPDTYLDVKPGQIGEIWLKSDSIIEKYWNKPKETEKAFIQGWFRTGDLGKRDEEGYYYLTDRLKNIIITGGENVSPSEIEKTINTLDDVVDSAVIGIPDEKWGEKIVAAIVKAPGSGDISQKIRDICKKHLHNWKCPKEIIFVKSLPRNTMGKILRQEIKNYFKQSPFDKKS